MATSLPCPEKAEIASGKAAAAYHSLIVPLVEADVLWWGKQG
jgi:hypothetical protein